MVSHDVFFFHYNSQLMSMITIMLITESMVGRTCVDERTQPVNTAPEKYKSLFREKDKLDKPILLTYPSVTRNLLIYGK